MANDVVFESERYEKRRSRMRWLLPLLGVLIVLIGIVAAALLLRGGKAAKVTGGEDTPYPYTWTVNKTGAVTLELDCAAAPGYAWEAEETPWQLRPSAEAKTKDGKTVFTLTPAGEGRATLRFVLRNTDEPADRIYELTFLAEITQETDRLHALPVSAAGHVTQGAVRGGDGSAYSYVIGSDADGDLYITVTLPQVVDEELNALYEQLRQQLEAGEITVEDVLEMDLPLPERNSDWDLEASNEQAARPMGVIDGDDQVSAYFRPGEETGAVTLRLFDRVTGDTITVECENNGGTLIVLSHTLTTN